MTESKDLYLLQDGTHAAPGDVSADKNGVLRHKNGLAVCLYEDGRPQTVGEDAERNMNVQAAKAGEEAKPVAVQPDTVRPASREVRPHAGSGQQSAADALGLKVGEPRPSNQAHDPKADEHKPATAHEPKAG